MAKPKPKDNSTFKQKRALRRRALADLAALGISQPAVLETHGGTGQLWKACYEHLPVGVVLEKDPRKAAILGLQRTHWRVYEGECVNALQEGVAGDLAIELLDCDPYGGALETVSAFFQSKRQFAPIMVVVVNDGMRQSLSLGKAWTIHALAPYVEQYGNDAIYPAYGEVCREHLEKEATAVGYTVSRFSFYYCGANGYLTHYYALLTRTVD